MLTEQVARIWPDHESEPTPYDFIHLRSPVGVTNPCPRLGGVSAEPAQLLAVLGRGILPADTPLLVADDLGVTRGDGCFDALRITNDSRGPRVHHRDAHLARFARSAARLHLDPPDLRLWAELIAQAVAQWQTPGEAILKLVLTRGREFVHTPAGGYLTITAAPDYSVPRRGVTAVTLDRGHASDAFGEAPWLLGGVKTLSYAVNVAARREAVARGVDEAIFRSSDGYLLEGPASGLVLAADDQLWTTPTRGTGILESVTIGAIFEVARQGGVATGEALFTPSDAVACEGVWLVSATRGVLPVLDLDGQPVNHDPGVTSVLASAGGFPGIA